jgi:CheY-like chemotaxis protein
MQCWALVVDDEEAVRRTVRMALEESGYRVAEAANGRDALALLRSQPGSAVVLLDMRMPEMDGAHMLAEVLGDADLAARHGYILMTALSHTEPQTWMYLSEEPITRLTFGLLFKPFDIAELSEVVAQVVVRLPAGDVPPPEAGTAAPDATRTP